ncbi:MAG TPA: YihY/virulence factor BrkB family protein [Bryobacteraceae bacterium]|nr:YihY/virulence factor BrkB family protein [Bryobacteraceae bacterium]
MRSGPLSTPGIDVDPSVRVKLRRIALLSWKELSNLIGEATTNWMEHNVPRLSASVAFYTLLSLAPLLIIVIAIGGAAFGREAAQGHLVWQIQDLIGRDGAETVQTLLKGANRPATGTWATLFGLLTLFYGAGTVVAELRDALNIIWCAPPSKTSGLNTILSMILDRTVAAAFVLGIGFLLLISLAVNAALSAIGDRVASSLPLTPWLFKTLDFLITYVVIAILFALMYKFVPNVDIEWRDVILGALLTSLLFGLGKTLIGIYLGTAGIASTYGAAGSLVVVLIWVYYSAQIFFLGAEFTRAYAQLYGSHPCDRVRAPIQVVSNIDNPEQAPPGESSLIIRP